MNDYGDPMKKQLFGNNIVPACTYCEHSKNEGNTQFCDAHRVLRNGKCRKFSYNPIKRTPRAAAALPTYSKDDFAL